MAFDESISGYLSLDCTLRVLDVIGCMLGYCIHLGHWYANYDDCFVLIEDSEIAISYVFHCYICLGYWHVDCIDCSSCFAWHIDSDFCHDCSDRLARMDSLSYIVWFHMLISLACILSWSSLSMLSISLFILIVIACMWTWLLYSIPCLTVCRMIALFCVIACCLSVWVAHLSSYLQPSGFSHFLRSILAFASVRPCMCLFSNRARS